MPQSPIASIEALGPAPGQRIACHLDSTFRALAGRAGTATPAYFRLVTGEPHPFGNLAVITDTGATAQAIEPLAAGAAPAAAVLPGCDIDGAVHATLAAAGFAAHPPMPAMAVEIDALAPAPLPPGCRFTRVGPGAEEGERWADAFAIGYELPPAVARIFAPGQIEVDPAPDATTQFFAVERDGRTVATSLLHLSGGVAGIYCVATIPPERGKGLGAHATAEPLRIARHLGYRVGALQSSEAGHSVYRRLGFADLGDVPLYIRIPGAADVAPM
ncbi:MAG: GNAT family N-acetyltransferase [Phycisphaerales bacterium JB039]